MNYQVDKETSEAYAEGEFLLGVTPQDTEIRWGLPNELRGFMGIFAPQGNILVDFLKMQIVERAKVHQDIILWHFQNQKSASDYEFVAGFLSNLFEQKKYQPNPRCLYDIIILDNILPELKLDTEFINECWRYNIMVLYVAKTPQEIASIILSNTETFIVFDMNEKDACCLSQQMNIAPKFLTTLPPNHFAILRSNVSDTPIVGMPFDTIQG